MGSEPSFGNQLAMARKRTRFKRLLADKRRGVTTTDVTNFTAYLNGTRSAESRKDRAAYANKWKPRSCAVVPFNKPLAGATPTAAEIHVVSVSLMSVEGLATAGLGTGDKLGWSDPAAGNTRNPNFYPAVIRCFLPAGTGTGTDVTSGITGRSYKRREGVSYSYPFGQDGTRTEEESMRQYLADEIKTANTAASITYDPEIFRAVREGASYAT